MLVISGSWVYIYTMHSKMPEKNLTICFTSYRNLSWIIWNLIIIFRLNPKIKCHLVVVNSNKYVRYRFDKILLRFCLLNRTRFISSFIHVRNSEEGLSLTGSAQHGAALDSIRFYVKTDHVLILDPDFIVVDFNWIESCFNLLDSNKVSLFGFPQPVEETNSHHLNSSFDYKFCTPLAFFLFGVSEKVLKYSFAPTYSKQGFLDVGHQLSDACLRREVLSLTGKSFSTRNTYCEIQDLNTFNCSFHIIPGYKDEIFAFHFGRSSNLLARRSKTVNMFMQVIYPYLDSVRFRKYIYDEASLRV